MQNHHTPASTVIVGVGNLLLGDDGVGVHAIRELQRDPPPGVDLVDAGTAILAVVDELAAAERLVFVDAVEAGLPPGALVLLQPKDMAAPSGPLSLHAVGASSAIRMLGTRGRVPQIEIVGVQPAVIAYGMELSPPVSRALPAVVRMARNRATMGTGMTDSLLVSEHGTQVQGMA